MDTIEKMRRNFAASNHQAGESVRATEGYTPKTRAALEELDQANSRLSSALKKLRTQIAVGNPSEPS